MWQGDVRFTKLVDMSDSPKWWRCQIHLIGGDVTDSSKLVEMSDSPKLRDLYVIDQIGGGQNHQIGKLGVQCEDI